MTEKERSKTPGGSRPSQRWLLLGLTLALAGGMVAWLATNTVEAADTADKPASSKAQERLETRKTLSPLRFSGQTAVTYKIARKIPVVLDGLYCYCRCKENPALKHKSLLSCYVDQHAAYCDVCQNEALMAYDMHLKGKSVQEMQGAIDARYGRRSPMRRNK